MGRKNKNGFRPNNTPLHIEIENRPERRGSCCAYCGRPLRRGLWYWVVDEYGQRVKKCIDERGCRELRKEAAEESYQAAVKNNTASKNVYWLKGESDHERAD